MRGVNHFAAKDVAVFVERDDQRAAELAEPSIKVGLLIFGMILFGEHQHHRRLIVKRLAPMCRHVSQLCLLAVPLEHACHRRLHVGGRARLFDDGGRKRFPGPDQRDIKTDVKAGRKELLGLIRLASFATHPPVLQL